MQKEKTVTKKLTEEEAEELAIAIEIAKVRALRKDIARKFSEEDVSKAMKILCIIEESLNSLSLVKAVLKDDNLCTLEGYELSGVRRVVDEVSNMLAAAADLHNGQALSN